MIRIGTRDSKLAVWQAEYVARALESNGHSTTLVFIKTEGDMVLDTPLPLMGGKGVFTKALDEALFQHEIDIAVHSNKDIPTRLPDGLGIAAVLEREDPRDVLVLRKDHSRSAEDLEREIAIIATSSMRRQGQWLHRHPHHKITDIRGNVQTRLRKLDESDWDGAIFAAAGLKRLGLDDRISMYLDWMLCAPAQGAVAVMARTNDIDTLGALAPIHHADTAICVQAERDCLNRLEGGCSAPVGVHVYQTETEVVLNANVLSADGKQSLDVELRVSAADKSAVTDLGRVAAERLLAAGAATLVQEAR